MNPEAWLTAAAYLKPANTKGRKEMLLKVDEEFAARKRQLSGELAKLRECVQQTRLMLDNAGFFARFWRRITLQERADKKRMRRWTAARDAMHQKLLLEAIAFQKYRHQRISAFEEDQREKRERIMAQSRAGPVSNEQAHLQGKTGPHQDDSCR